MRGAANSRLLAWLTRSSMTGDQTVVAHTTDTSTPKAAYKSRAALLNLFDSRPDLRFINTLWNQPGSDVSNVQTSAGLESLAESSPERMQTWDSSGNDLNASPSQDQLHASSNLPISLFASKKDGSASGNTNICYNFIFSPVFFFTYRKQGPPRATRE